MASLKRKTAAPELSTNDKLFYKRMRLASAHSPSQSKGQKDDHEGKARDLQNQISSSGVTKTALTAVEQPAFPRGGGSLLTPIERKQIQAQASRDVLLEQKKSDDLFGSSNAFQQDSEDEEMLGDESSKVKKVRRKSSKKEKATAHSGRDNTAVRVEGLSYKRITEGSLVLGQVSSINSRSLTISLPNNLTGYVPLTAISTQLTQKIEALLNEDNEQDDEEASDVEDQIDLYKHFYIGQYLRVSVTSTEQASTEGISTMKRRIELSLEPTLTNAGLSRPNLAVGCTVQAAVASVEDHGLVMDLGIGDSTVQGFLSTKELGRRQQISNMRVGTVMLCLVTDLGSNGRIIKLSAKEEKLGSTKKSHYLDTAPTIDCFLPGTAAEILLTDVTSAGLAGKVMGMLDVTADVVHSGARVSDALEQKYQLGSKIKGRLLYTLPLADSKKLGFSVLDHVVTLQPPTAINESGDSSISVSSIIPKAKVIRVESGLGLYLDLGSSNTTGFAHISRLSDKKLDSLSDTSGPYKLGSVHTARVLDFSSIDNMFIVSLQEKVIQQPFLRVEDVTTGEVVNGKIEKVLIGETGIKGLIVSISEGVTGLVPHSHLSDVILQHPEKRFREGLTVRARVLSTDPVKHQIRLTLKKTLVNSDQKVWKSYNEVAIGDSSPGTLIKVDPHGAVVQFYGLVKAFLPVAEMSEAYIKDATQHFRVGQVVTVNAVTVDAESERLTVSCKDPSASNRSLESTIGIMTPGTLVDGTVFEKSQDDLLLRLELSGVIARLHVDHASDGSLRKREAVLKKIRVGQLLQNLIILEVDASKRIVKLSNRASLVQASQDGSLLRSFEDLREGLTVSGIISNITSDGIFVKFAAGINGLVPKGQVPVEAEDLPEFGFSLLQPIKARVFSIKYQGEVPRFWLTMRNEVSKSAGKTNGSAPRNALIDPVDELIESVDEFSVGKATKARIVSVKETQINVELAKDVQGRIDVSEVFDKWEDIKDRKRPLRAFMSKQVLPVRILGAHDTRNHRFLPISHRSGRTPVLELSAKPSVVADSASYPLTLADVKAGSSWLGFVNNIGDDCLWVSLSPSVRGRIRAIDVSDDLSLVADLGENFPIGSALKVRVASVDIDKNRIDLSAKSSGPANHLTMKEISKGMILPGKITRASDRQVLVQLTDTIVGAVDLIDMADDYSQVNPTTYQKNDVVRVCVMEVDVPNKKILLSLRPSKVLSSSLPVVDPEITSAEQLKVNDVVRGFISNVADKGLFVALGHGVTAFVRVTNLSDSYLKEWKDHFERDQLVKGKIIIVDQSTGHVQMSLKESILDANYVAPLAFTDLHVGQVVTGKVAKVAEFGVFIVVDNSANVRGLCHRSEIAESRVEDASKLYNEGDVVKAIILNLEPDKRRISFGLKASYFKDNEDQDEDVQPEDDEDDEDDADGGVLMDLLTEGVNVNAHSSALYESSDEDESIDEEEVDANLGLDAGFDEDSSSSEVDMSMETSNPAITSGLSVGGFDWVGVSHEAGKGNSNGSDVDAGKGTPKPKKRRRAEIQPDKTGDLDSHGPQSVDDYERLLLGEPDSSLLWLHYMAFHLELGDADQARQIGERAIKTIGLGQEQEKMNVWVALLNLENTFGDDESIDAAFKRACEFNEPQEIHSRLTSIYIQSGKITKADDLFQTMVKKFAQDPKIWVNYATFLFDTVSDAEKARQLLPRALQTLPQFVHLDITSKFAQLEFHSSSGLPERGRTIFEGLLDSFPKRMDLWNVLLDLEIKAGDKEQVRRLFDRVFSSRKVKNKQAKFFFKRWLTFEEVHGDARSIESVKAKAVDFVRSAAEKSDGS